MSWVLGLAMRVRWSISTANWPAPGGFTAVNIAAAMDGGHAAAGLPIALHATRSVSHCDSRDRPALQSRVRPPFAQLAGDRQLRLLEQLEKDEIALPSLSSKLFFDLLWRNTEEGYFADPLYGSNRDVVAGIGWVAGESLTGQAGLHNRKPSAVPFKHHAEHRHHIPRARYRVTNQPEYDAALRRRGGAAA
jgi:Gluconate 2-dehydrogenase subunit 3